jgi:hypothetical protein
MSRWYQNVLTGKQVEVRTLEEDDFYAANAPNWARIAAPSPAKPAVAITEPVPAAEQYQPKRRKRA